MRRRLPRIYGRKTPISLSSRRFYVVDGPVATLMRVKAFPENDT